MNMPVSPPERRSRWLWPAALLASLCLVLPLAAVAAGGGQEDSFAVSGNRPMSLAQQQVRVPVEGGEKHRPPALPVVPSDPGPQFSLEDVLRKYRAGFVTSAAVLALLGVLLVTLFRHIRRLGGVVSDQKRAVEALTLAASVFEHAHEGIMITNADGQIVDVNSAFTEVTGYVREEAIGRTPRLLRSGKHDDAFYAGMWRALKEEGRWTGEVWNRNKAGNLYAVLQTVSAIRDDAGAIVRFVSLFSDISQIKEQQVALERIAHYDLLTRLPNRFLLADRMHQAMARSKRSGEMLAVCMMDLDGFKPVNDKFGHKAGDAVLQEIARRLLEAIRADDTAARIGGDEFALLMGGFRNAEACELALRRLLVAVAQPFSWEGNSIRVSGSLGVTLYQGEAREPDQLLRHADQAMYEAKAKGKNRYHLFDTAVELRLKANQGLYKRIESALERGQFCLYYQPKVDCRRGRVQGFEALIRWNHPTLGLRAPAEFLPIIEHDDLIVRLGEWVIGEALRQMASWRQQGLDLPVSMNVTVRQFVQEAFATRLKAALAACPDVPADQLEIELVETAALEDINAVSAVMKEQRGLGLHFALDDFGTGYSSLVHLKRLPVDTLKIDQTFVRDMLDDPGDLAIAQGVIGLGQAFQHKVVAEGVESTEQILMLLELGCDVMQGYVLARPMPADQVFAWARNFRPDPRWQVASSRFPSRANFVLLLMEVAHRHWLDLWLDESLPDEARPTLDITQCQFQKLYQGLGERRYGGLAPFKAIDELHRATHRCAKDLWAAYEGQDGEAIRLARLELERRGQALFDAIPALRYSLPGNPSNPMNP